MAESDNGSLIISAGETFVSSNDGDDSINNGDTGGDGVQDSKPFNPADFATTDSGESIATVGESGTPEKRGRGRPRKHDSGDSSKRTGSRESKPTGSLALTEFATQLKFAHDMAAVLLKSPELSISENDAKLLAKGCQAVLAQYSFNPNPKVMAWLQLSAAAGMIYGPRVAMIMDRRKKSKAANHAVPTNTFMQREVQPNNVSPINGGGGIYKFQ